VKSRNTPQKSEIFTAVQELKIHPTAEQIYDYLQKSGSNTSKATVYRVLRQMADQKKILLVQMPQGADRFDFTIKNHHHIYCRSCGNVSDVKVSLPSLKEVVVSSDGYEVFDGTLVYEGLCPQCQKASAVTDV